MTLIEEAEAMAERLGELADSQEDLAPYDCVNDSGDLRDAAAIIRRMVAELRHYVAKARNV
jgi:hypothetical protein